MFRYIVFLFCLAPTLLFSQLYDYHWVMGGGPNNPEDMEGGTLFDFHTDPVSISYRPLGPGGRTSAFTNICNAEGNLQLYSNNCSVINKQDLMIQSGNGLNYPGYVYQEECAITTSGNGYNTRSSFFLPFPGSTGKYVLFQLRYDFTASFGHPYRVGSFLYSVVDAAAANGQGAIIEKNTLLVQDTLCDMLAAVRHGNGRDWWVVCPKYNSNEVFMALLTPEGVQVPSLRQTPLTWGGDWNIFWWEQAVFSPDGQRYARANGRNDIQVFGFDRCSGEFSNPLHLTVPPDDKFTTGLAISANSRFVYYSTGLKVYQFDLAASSPQASRVLLAEYDETDLLAIAFNAMQLAPDGKIYITNSNGIYRLTVINNPNAPGLACNLVQHGVELSSKIGRWVPNFPNFRLYDQQGSLCDTLASVAVHNASKPVSLLSVAPNPAQDFVQIGYVSEQVGQLQIFDAAGRLVWSQVAEQGSQADQVDVSTWSAGFYQVVLRVGREVVRQRFVVLR